MGVAEEVGCADLEGDDEENKIFGQWLWPAELCDLVKKASDVVFKEG